MAEWFDDLPDTDDSLAEDTTQSTASGNDNDPFGFGNSTGTDDGDSYGDNGFGGISDTSDSQNTGGAKKSKKGALIAIGIGTVLLIVLAVVFGGSSSDNNKNTQKNQNNTQQSNAQQSQNNTQQSQGNTQQNQNGQQNQGNTQQGQNGQQLIQSYQVSTTGNTWSKISADDLNTANATIILEDTFDVKYVTIYADIMNGYALRAEASGTLSGRNNSKSYSTTIPVDAALNISAYLQNSPSCPLKVSYKIIEKNSTVFVYDIELK